MIATAGTVRPRGPGDPGGPGEPPPDIGRPVASAAVYILDERLRPVPPGGRGELYLGGPGVARGYLGRPGLTAERFVPDPFGGEPGGRLYRTGDLARFLPDGRIAFLGRTDAQIKLRGNRVEPGEIEAALVRHPAVGQAHVSVRDDGPGGGRRLVAHLAPGAGADVPSPTDLRRHLERELPKFMVPAAYVRVDRMPLKPNGKIDAGALPPPAEPSERATREPPATDTERVVAGIWAEVLDLPDVGVRDNFFDLGGHSMLVHRVRDRLAEALGHAPPLLDLFRHPTVRSLAGRIDGGERAGDAFRPDMPAAGDRRAGRARLGAVRARRNRPDGRDGTEGTR
ncbi:phosphopantetheine-binding protein [Actinomadura yumaensis]|uniref:phosphopantetheine-binding protein n=1 Tax=Actinomadura yumaensis TaxID=111807 RepID=UPI003607F34F